MTTITLDELRERLDEVVDRITGGEPIAVTRDGVSVFELRPTGVPEGTSQSPRVHRTQEEVNAYIAEWRKLARDIAPHWPEGVSAVDAVHEQRREL